MIINKKPNWISIISFILGFFLSESYKYLVGKPTILF